MFMSVCVSECAKSVCFLVCAYVHSLHTCTSKHPLLISTKSPRLYKVFLSAWSSVWMKVTKLTSLKKRKKKDLSQLIWNSVSLVSNSGQKGSLFILKNSLKIGFIVGCCFLFLKLFSCSSCCCCGSKVPLYYWAWMSRPCPPVLGSMGVSKGGLCADMVIPGCDEGPPCISMAWWGW